MNQQRLRFAIRLLILLFAVCGVVTNASASSLVYTNRTQWATAIGGGIITENFETSPVGVLPIGTTQLGLVAFTTDDNGSENPSIRNGGTVNSTRELFGRVDNGAFGGTFHIITFPTAVRAFGADFNSTTSGDGLQVVIGSDVITFSQHLTGAGNGFLGVVSSAPFTAITFRPAGLPLGEGFGLDNLSFQPVPEPPSIVCGGATIISLFIRRRRIIACDGA